MRYQHRKEEAVAMQQKRTLDEVRDAAEELGFQLTIEERFFELNKGAFGETFTNNEMGRGEASLPDAF